MVEVRKGNDSQQEVLESILLLLADVGEAIVRESQATQSPGVGIGGKTPDLTQGLVDQHDHRMQRYRS